MSNGTIDESHKGTSMAGPVPMPRIRAYLPNKSVLIGLALLVPPVLYLTLVFLRPLVGMLFASVYVDGVITLSVFRSLFETPVYVRVIVYTYAFSAAIAVLCLLLAYPIAYAISTYWKKYATQLLALLVLVFWTGLLIRSYAWMVILGREGVIATTLGLVGIETPRLLHNSIGAFIGVLNILVPYMVLVLYPIMRTVDPGLVRAAQTLGATPRRAFWRVYVPATKHGIIAGGVLVFMITLGFYVTPALLGGPQNLMISQVIARQVRQLLDFNAAGALSAVLMSGSLVLLYVYDRAVGMENLGAKGVQ